MLPLPKSNGINVKMSMFAPSASERSISRLP